MFVGLGPIGCGVVRQVPARRSFRVVATVDVDPQKTGKDLSEVAGLASPLRVAISGELGATLRRAKPDVVALCTSSSLARVYPQLAEILKARVPVVSTTEELA